MTKLFYDDEFDALQQMIAGSERSFKECAAFLRPDLKPESAYAWLRMLAGVLIGTVGSVGMWSVVVALPTVQADFGVTRAEASMPYTLAMLGFAAGAVLMGGIADRRGIGD